MTKIPKKCLTCKFMGFEDDNLETIFCAIDQKIVSDDFICDEYDVNEAVIEDAKQGCW